MTSGRLARLGHLSVHIPTLGHLWLLALSGVELPACSPGRDHMVFLQVYNFDKRIFIMSIEPTARISHLTELLSLDVLLTLRFIPLFSIGIDADLKAFGP